jgi:hypothetical protein
MSGVSWRIGVGLLPTDAQNPSPQQEFQNRPAQSRQIVCRNVTRLTLRQSDWAGIFNQMPSAIELECPGETFRDT